MAIEQEFSDALIETLSHRASDLLAVAEHLEGLSYPSEGPNLLARFVSTAAKLIINELQTLEGAPYSTIELPSRRWGQLITILHSFLEYIYQAQSERVPDSLVQPLEAIVRKHVPGATIIVRFTWDFNYYFQELAAFLKKIPLFAPSLSKLSGLLPSYLPVFSFPVTARGDFLLHVAFGHEIGHFLGSVNKIYDRVPISIDQRLLEAVRPAEQAQMLKTIRSWYMELCADLIGTRLFGPACFLAFSQVVLHALNEPGPNHPAPVFRLNAMLSLLAELQFINGTNEDSKTGLLPRDYCEFFDRYRTFINTYKEDSTEALYQLVSRSVKDVEGQINKHVQSVFEHTTYVPSTAVPAMEQLADLLLQLVPPDQVVINDKPTHADLIGVLNAGWFVYSCKREALFKKLDAKSPTEKALVRKKINDLMSKAIEDTVIFTLWDKAKTLNNSGPMDD